MKTWLLDTETLGLHGLPVLLQYAEYPKGDVQVMHLWTEQMSRVVNLIELFVDGRVVAHNLRFDWFMLSKMYGLMRHLLAQGYHGPLLQVFRDNPQAVIDAEFAASKGQCLKPRAAIDTLILAQRGEAQAAVMDSKPIYVRRVPRSLSENIRAELESRTNLPWILFANRADQEAPKWSICDRKDEETGEIEQSWVDLKMSFSPSNGLKPLARFLLGYEEPANFQDIAPAEFPIEEGFAPYVSLISSAEKGWLYQDKKTWPLLVEDHVRHWATNADAMAYAIEDIKMLRGLYEFFGAQTDDSDSMLACQVASVRIKGFDANLDKMAEQRAKSIKIVEGAKLNVNSPPQVRGFIAEALDEMEQFIIAKGCDSKVIDQIKLEFILDEEEECYCEDGIVTEVRGNEWEVSYQEIEKTCPRCEGRGKVGPTGPCGCCEGTGKDGDDPCRACDGSGLNDHRKMPVVLRAEHIELVRQHIKRIELYDKILLAKRCYPDFNVVGAKSGRMSGASGLNFQGVAKDKEVRELFNFADEGWVLSGGDYDSQELAVMATTAGDNDLLEDIKSGKSLHALMAAELFQTTYEDIMANKANDPLERYDKAKSAVYAMAYGGTVETIAKNIGLPVEDCQKGFNGFLNKYANMGANRRAVTDRYSSMKQGPEGHIVYQVPEEMFVESIFGFRRYFTNEYAIQSAIYHLACNMPQRWKDLDIKVQRTEGKVQTIAGAISSALYGAAFSIQNRVIRAALNHEIQSASRTITLGLQYAIWELQPQGIHDYELVIMGIHDELPVCSKPEVAPLVTEVVKNKLREQTKDIPLISLCWASGLDGWYHLKKAKPGNCEVFVPCGFAELAEAA